MNTDQEARLAQEDWAVYLMIGASLALATMWAVMLAELFSTQLSL